MTLEKELVIGRYKIISKIGAGGMGEVYLAEDTRLDRRVALKILPAEFAADSDRMSRFVREAKSASALNHPNIITIYEIGESDDTHYIAAEFIDGKTLNDYVKSNPLNYKSALEIAIQIASALDEAHHAGIVHRDIKPDNVIVRANGLVKILDFGIAKLSTPQTTNEEDATAIKGTSPGMIIGTANYMSPEQAKGKEVDSRTDIFSFGVVLYEMMAGHLPFEGETAMEMIGAILHKEPLLPDKAKVPPEIEKIIKKCLRKDRDERYQTIKDVLIDVQDVKQELEFQDKLKKTISPDKEEPKTQILPATTADEIYQTTTNETISGQPSRSKLLTIGLAVLLISVIGFFGSRYFTATKQIESIAVLPFENASGNADLDYLSDGVSESVIDRLSQLPQLKVIARSSSFRYRSQNLDLKQIADALGVQAIVTGRVIERGDSYLIRVDVTDVRENKQLWGDNFTRKASDIQVLQTDISREIADNLRFRLSGTETQQLAKQPTNPQAYELVLKGIFYRNKGGGENVEKSVECFQQAIAADPNYAPAYAGLADSYRFAGGDPKEMLPKREAAIRRALELDETLSEAHFSMGQYQRDLWNWQAAEREYRRAMQLNPNSAHAYSGLSGLLSLLGRHDEALAEGKRATELDPVGVVVNTVAGRTLQFARRYDEAIQQLKKTIELDPSSPTAHLRIADVYFTKSMYSEAAAEYQLAIKFGDKDNEAQIRLGAAYAKMGERERALKMLKSLQTGGGYISPGQLAILYTALGETEQALATLERAYAERSPSLQFLKVDPMFDSLRPTQRFQDLLRRMNLPE